jgi:prepilin-type N-terminal cleavage/methylation domain-containing protein
MKTIHTKREDKKRGSHFSFSNERWQQTQYFGFTLIETLVAVAILSIAVSAPLVSASRALVTASLASDQLTASYLAQEGIEYVRSMRDNEFLAALATNTTSSACTWSGGNPSTACAAWLAFLTNATSDPSSIAACHNNTLSCLLDPTQGLPIQTCTTATTCKNFPLYFVNGTYTQTQSGKPTPFARYVSATDVPSGTPNGYNTRIVSTVTWVSHGRTYSITVADQLTPWQ